MDREELSERVMDLAYGVSDYFEREQAHPLDAMAACGFCMVAIAAGIELKPGTGSTREVLSEFCQSMLIDYDKHKGIIA